MIINIPLTYIKPNPWQTRASLNEVHIRDLAIDIAARKSSRPDTLGLLQLPAGRLIDPQGGLVHPATPDQVAHYLGAGCTIQLAYGHNRAAAFRILAQGDPDAFDPDPDYTSLILNLVNFTDEEMATSAWSENAARQDLTAIEEAWAIQRMLDSFNWNQTQVAERLNLDRSTIANKLRLLRCPNDVQVALKNRAITERQAVALLPVYNLPPSAQEQAQQSPYAVKPAELLERALDGHSSDDLRYAVERTLSHATRSFTLGRGALFPLDHWFEVDDEQAARLQSHQCSECIIRVKHDKELRCPDFACWDLKAALWTDSRLIEAEAATGLARLNLAGDTTPYHELETFYTARAAELAQQILDRDGGCPHDRLRLDCGNSSHTGGAFLPDFDDVRVVCHHGDGDHCKCLAALKSTATRERNAADPEIQARRQREHQVRQLTDPAVQALADALIRQHQGAWRLLLKRLRHTYGENTADWSLEKIMLKIAHEIMDTQLQWTRDNPQGTQTHIVTFFNAADLPLPWPDSNPLCKIQRQFERIEGWFTTSARHHPPSPQAITGNQTNLAHLLNALEPLPPSEQRDQLTAQITTLQLQLTDLDAIQQEWDFIGNDALEWNAYGNCLLIVPPDDPRFERDLNQVTRPAVIRYAAALLGDDKAHADRFKAFSYRLRLLENPKYTPLTHKQLADKLNVPINTIAIIRQILSATSEKAQWALGLHNNNVLRAAQQLATSNCGTKPEVHAAITPVIIQAVRDHIANTQSPISNTQPQGDQ